MLKKSSWIVAAVLMLPGAAFAQKVNVDSDPSVDFSRFKTYAWTKGTPSPSPLGEDRVHASVEQHMAAAGFTQVTSGTPDVVIATHVLTKEEQEIISSGYGYGAGYYRYGGGTTTTTVETYIQGTLVLDMYDAATKKLAWRGVGTDTASDKADKNAKKVVKALDKMFKEYPPPKPKAKP